jgi:hypothetical protein
MARESALQPPDSRKRSDGDDNAPSNDGNEGGQYQETHGSKQSNQADVNGHFNGPSDIDLFSCRSFDGHGLSPPEVLVRPLPEQVNVKQRAVGNYLTVAAASCAAKANVAAWTATAIKMPVIVNPRKAITIAITFDTLCAGLKSP